MQKLTFLFILFILPFYIFLPFNHVKADQLSDADIMKKRMNLYKRIESTTLIPWYYIAAVDHYERSMYQARGHQLSDTKKISAIQFSPTQWIGDLNPNLLDTSPQSIAFFQGLGMDGDGDLKASMDSDMDVLYSFANYALKYGTDENNFRLCLWNFYKRDKAVGLIMQKAALYKNYQTLQLNTKTFPIPQGYNYTFHSTWGDARGWGGKRIHEGTDIFANYGVPVRSTCYGVIEMKGWNKFGGWRIGIRDVNNTYHYFAHLNGFAKNLSVGQTVKPGQLIGSVGSTGYGPPGTAGKFPPHLHYGVYKDNGKTEWSFDPYPLLRQWERTDKLKKR